MDELVNNRLAVYTAIFGNYDKLIDPIGHFPNCDFICFTDQVNLESNKWQIRLVNQLDYPPNLMNRKYKLFPNLFLSEYQYSLYLDANIRVKKDLYPFINLFTNADMLLPRHSLRCSILEEVVFLLKMNRVDKSKALNQLSTYFGEGFLDNVGLFENNIILRKHHSEIVKEAMNLWWEQLLSYTQRDQLSLPYCIWKLKVSVGVIPFNARGNKYFYIYPHLRPHKNKVYEKFLFAKSFIEMNYQDSWVIKLINFLRFG